MDQSAAPVLTRPRRQRIGKLRFPFRQRSVVLFETLTPLLHPVGGNLHRGRSGGKCGIVFFRRKRRNCFLIFLPPFPEGGVRFASVEVTLRQRLRRQRPPEPFFQFGDPARNLFPGEAGQNDEEKKKRHASAPPEDHTFPEEGTLLHAAQAGEEERGQPVPEREDEQSRRCPHAPAPPGDAEKIQIFRY